MQVNNVNTNFPIQSKTKQNNNNKQNTSFKGLDSFCLGVANSIETGGLVVSFTLQDMLGTNLPRPFMGLRRNKAENNGEANKNFAAKEAVREFLTGPSMFIIPGGMLYAANKLAGSACEIPSKFIKTFGDIQVQDTITNSKIPNKQEFYKSTFTEIIKNAKGESAASNETAVTAERFAQTLAESNSENLKSTINNLSEEFVSISKAHAKNASQSDFTVAKTAEGAAAPFSKTVSYMVGYANDVVEKTQGKALSEAKASVEKMVNKKIVGRFALNLAMYSGVMGFLQVIPKLYNNAEGNENSGLKGLMQKETFNDKELNEKEKQKHEKTIKTVKDKSNPSFGSWEKAAKAITGNGRTGKFAEMMEFDGCNVSFTPLVGIMGGGIMYPRVKNAKDKYDREEIIRRDAITCVVMCVGEKILRKGFSKLNEMTSGLVLAVKDEKFKDKSIFGKISDYLKPVNGVQILSSEQIRAKYSNIDKYKDGIKGFCNFISEQGGDLKKVFSLTDESKEIVNSLLKSKGKNLENADNKIITEVLSDTKNEAEAKKLSDLFYPSKRIPIQKRSLFDKILRRKEIIEDNPWVQKTRTYNARFTALSVLVLVPVFLGFMLPAINEKSTKKRINEEKAALGQKNSNSAIDNNKFDYMKEIKKSPVFADMTKYVK